MDQILQKLARQLDAMDEASLMALWDKYAAVVQRFEPSQRWQDAVLILSFIQAKRWKNQLFNSLWAERVRAGQSDPDGFVPPAPAFDLESHAAEPRRAKVLAFSAEKKTAK